MLSSGARTAALLAVMFSRLAFPQEAKIDTLFQNAVTAQQRGDYGDAVQGYREVLRLDPNVADARANLAAALVHLGQFDEAIREYRTALQQKPSDAIRLNLALAFYKKADFRAASGELQDLLKSDPKNVRVATLFGDCETRLGNGAQAITLLRPFAAEHPDDLDLAFVLGSALLQGGDTKQAIPLLERVATHGNSPDAYLLAGSAYLKLNDKGHALQDLQAAAGLNPNLPGLHTQLGIIAEGSGDDAGAERELRQAVQANGNDFPANVHLGGVLYNQRKLDEAKIYIQHALQLDPSSTFARYELALVESAGGQIEDAVADLEKVEQADPSWLDPHVRLAALYYKVNRPSDGLRERDTVAKLGAEQQKQATTTGSK
jgi:tetratricopeptide (TPR) repeat protein